MDQFDKVLLEKGIQQSKQWLSGITNNTKNPSWVPSEKEVKHYSSLNHVSEKGINNIYLTHSYDFENQNGLVFDYKHNALVNNQMIKGKRFITCTITVPILRMSSVTSVGQSASRSSSSNYSGDSRTSATAMINEQIKLYTTQMKNSIKGRRATLMGAFGIDASAVDPYQKIGENDLFSWSPSLGDDGLFFVGKMNNGTRYIVVSTHVEGSAHEASILFSNLREHKTSIKEFMHDVAYYKKMKELAYRNACRLAYEFSLRIHASINCTTDSKAYVDVSHCKAKPIMAVPDIVQYSDCFEHLDNIKSEKYKEHDYKVVTDRVPISLKPEKKKSHGLYLFMAGTVINPTFTDSTQRQLLCWSDPRKSVIIAQMPETTNTGCCYVPLVHFCKGTKTRLPVARSVPVNWLDAECDDSEMMNEQLTTPSRFILNGDHWDSNTLSDNDLLSYMKGCIGKHVTCTHMEPNLAYVHNQ